MHFVKNALVGKTTRSDETLDAEQGIWPSTLALWGSVLLFARNWLRRQVDGEGEPVGLNQLSVPAGVLEAHVAFRRIHFLPNAAQLYRIYNIVRWLIGADSPTIHHYELLIWSSGNGCSSLGCHALSFDWAPALTNERKDNVRSLYSIRQARLQKKQWAPNKDPSRGNVVNQTSGAWGPLQKNGKEGDEEVVFYDDDNYEYIILGSRKVAVGTIFDYFRDSNARTPYGESSTVKVPGVPHYSIVGYWNFLSRDAARAKCCYSYARLVASKILDVEESNLEAIAKRGPWLDYASFYHASQSAIEDDN